MPHQASLLIHTRRGEEVRQDWVRLLDTAATNLRRLVARPAASAAGAAVCSLPRPDCRADPSAENSSSRLTPEKELVLVRTELENMAELVEMSGAAFRSREMEVIQETGLAALHLIKVIRGAAIRLTCSVTAPFFLLFSFLFGQETGETPFLLSAFSNFFFWGGGIPIQSDPAFLWVSGSEPTVIVC